MDLEFFIECRPRAKPRPRFGRGRAYTPPDYAKWEKKVALAIRQHCIETGTKPATGPVMLHLRFFFRNKTGTEGPRAKKPDLDNLVKAVKDAANGILYVDDAQVWCCDASKWTVKRKEGIQVRCMSENWIKPMNCS